MNLIPIITEYLNSHRRLVVPQLGAFIRKNEGDEVVFSEMLKRDDGVLRSLLVAEGLGEIEASGLIDRFIFELRHTISEGSVFRAEGLGVFAQGTNGTIRFRYLPQSQESESSIPAGEPEGASQEESVESQLEPAVQQESVVEKVRSSEHVETRSDEESGLSESSELSELADEKRTRIKGLMRFSEEHPREHRSSSQPRRTDPSVRGLRYGKPQKSTEAYTYVNSAPSRRPDTFIILAVLAVVIALGAILYGYWNDRRKEQVTEEYHEQPTLSEYPLSISDSDI